MKVSLKLVSEKLHFCFAWADAAESESIQKVKSSDESVFESCQKVCSSGV